MLQDIPGRSQPPVYYELNAIVCARSFFEGLRKSKLPRRAVLAALATVLTLVLIFALLFNASARTAAESEAYAIVVNGTALGVSDDEQVLRELLDSILDSYRTEHTVEIYFNENISVELQTAGGAPRGADEIFDSVRNAVTVTRVDRERTEEYTPYETIMLGVDSMYEGESTVITEGAPGICTVVERVSYVNDTETSRESSLGAVITLPVTEVVAYGTTERPRTMSYGELIWPVEDAVVVSFFGPRAAPIAGGSTNHQGIDIDGYRGQSIFAADGGLVIFAGEKRGFGLTLQIEHDNGDVTLYAHCERLIVRENERVARGEEIAQMGMTGVASGVHLHFEVWPGNGAPMNPLDYLPRQ